MKLHLCCGDIYLAGYVNIDIEGCLVDEHTVDYYPTDLAHYYANKILFSPRTKFIDRQLDLLQIPWPIGDESIEEIVMIQAIEHFKRNDAQNIIRECKRALKSGGKLLIDFPDIGESVRRYDTEAAMRLIYGSERNAHVWGYGRDTFRLVLGKGWSWVEYKEIVKHEYPVIGCEAVRE